MDLWETWSSNVNYNFQNVTTFLDLSAAFDCVDKNTMINKMNIYKFYNSVVNLIDSYLSYRSQLVVIGGQQSNYLSVNSATPQGSILGPLLFLLYINDISESSQLISFHLFADATALFYSHKGVVLKKVHRIVSF